MSRFTEKVKNLFTIDYDDYEDDYYDDYDEEEEIADAKFSRPKQERIVVQNKVSERSRVSTPSSSGFRNTKNRKVVPMKATEMEVCIIKPTHYENTRDVIDMLLEGKAVILNLEGMKLDLAQRVVDSVSGGCYALQGNLQKISGYIYLVTPNSVDITGDFGDLVQNSMPEASVYRRNF